MIHGVILRKLILLCDYHTFSINNFEYSNEGNLLPLPWLMPENAKRQCQLLIIFLVRSVQTSVLRDGNRLTTNCVLHKLDALLPRSCQDNHWHEGAEQVTMPGMMGMGRNLKTHHRVLVWLAMLFKMP